MLSAWSLLPLTLGLAACAQATPEFSDSEPPVSLEVFRLVTTDPAEVVFDWSTDRCTESDVPDLPARALRDANGNVQLISSHLEAHRAVGPTLDSVVHGCEILNQSTHSADPAQYDDYSWLSSPYTTDGQTIYAVMHQEFRGWEHGLICPEANFACSYNTLTMSVSTDAGATYNPIATPPAHLVAGPPNVYEAGAGPYGVLEPSNIIERDGAFYMFVHVDTYRSDDERVCLMRTFDLSDPSGWRYWDGADFTVANVDPYLDPVAADASPQCASTDSDLGMMSSSVTFNTFLNAYVMVGITSTGSDQSETWGVFYSMSYDLIEWTPRSLLAELELPWTHQPGDGNMFLYPSLIDPDSESRNFDTTDDQAFVYLTRFNESATRDRDLIRIPVQFFNGQPAAAAANVPFVGRDLP